MSVSRPNARSGVRWSAAGQLARQGLQLLTLVVLTRLIGPESYGLLSMAVAVVVALDLLKDLGTGAAIVQREECDEPLLSSVFWLNAAVGAALTAGTLLGAPLAALYFREPAVAPVLRALSLSFLVSSLGIVHLALLQRAVAFRAIALIETGSALAGAMVGLGMALTGYGVWSLVAQSLTTVAVSTALAWLASSWRPRAAASRAALRSVGGFGAGLVGYNILNYLSRNADYLLIGRFLGAASLGTYTLAYRIMTLPQQVLSQVLNRVMYPVLARLDDDEAFQRAYLQLCATLAFVATPVFVALFALREPLVRGFFGAEWLPVIPLLAILAPVGLLQSLAGTTGLIYQARARTDWLFAWGLGSGVVTVAGFVLGLRWGVTGVAAAYALTNACLAVPVFAIPFRLVGLPLGRFALALAPALACGAAMLLAIAALAPLAAALPEVARTLLLSALGGGVYLSLSALFNRPALRELQRAVSWRAL